MSIGYCHIDNNIRSILILLAFERFSLLSVSPDEVLGPLLLVGWSTELPMTEAYLTWVSSS